MLHPSDVGPARGGATAQTVVVEVARAASVLGSEMADIAGTIDDTRKLALSQAQRFESLGHDVAGMVRNNQSILQSADTTARSATQTREDVEQALAAAVGRIETGLASVGASLRGVLSSTNDIARIAQQTRIVALNAAVQAAHAADGRPFAVVAAAVRELAEQIQTSSRTVATTLTGLEQSIRQLTTDEPQSGTAEGAGLRSVVESALKRFKTEFGEVESRIGQVADLARSSLEDCAKVDQAVQSMGSEVMQFETAISAAAVKSENILRMSEALMELTANSGAETDDTPFIQTAIAVAHELQALLEAAVAKGDVSIADLFDESYKPVANTDPPQFLTRFVALTDKLFTPVQETVLEWSDRVVFCAGVDRNGFLPTHNLKYSKPQGSDPVWNAANCRNRRLFQDRTGAAAGKNVRPFLVQTYRRDMGGGKFAILKEVDAPIAISGRHWGNVRLAYRVPGV